MGFRAVTVVGDGSHDQDEHQDRRHRLQCGNEHLADKAEAGGGVGGEHRHGDTGDEADHDLDHQAGAVQQV
ncbi:hypothetical protein D3C77_417910 [compost metagenome]